MSRVFMNKGKNMVVIDKEVRIEDELVMFPPFLQNRANSLPCFVGEFRPEKYIIQGGFPHRSCSWECYLSKESNPV